MATILATFTIANVGFDNPHEIQVPDGAAPCRWIGRCRGCRAAVRLEGVKVQGRSRGPRFDRAAVLAADGKLFLNYVLNEHENVVVRCTCEPDRRVLLALVRDGGKPDSKRHNCGARCTGATGPACDCRCRGANHGAGAAS